MQINVTEWSTSVDAPHAQQYEPAASINGFSGSKYAGGYVETEEDLFGLDYWTLRMRSSSVFHRNLYARGVLNRLVTNEINKGLVPESMPFEDVIGLSDNELAEWSDSVEDRFGLWADDPQACDYDGQRTFGQLQELARLEALIGGDVLTIRRPGRKYNMPLIQVLRGDCVRSPFGQRIAAEHEICDGIEYDANGREVAYWVHARGKVERVEAFGARSGRRIAWMTHGVRRRADQRRGEPILSVVLQSLRELDRYRDNALRKSVINSMLALFIQKDYPVAGTKPLTAAATRWDTVGATSTTQSTERREFDLASSAPGIVIEELNHGEKPVAFGSDGTDTNLGPFESAIIRAMAWALEIPPEIVELSFTNNYSASQAAINEFKMYLDGVWANFGASFCAPVWTEWLINDALTGRMSAKYSPMFLAAWRDNSQREVFNAWRACDWYGNVKPSTDMVKMGKAAALLIDLGLSTHTREARTSRGTSFRKNVKTLARENMALVKARRPLEYAKSVSRNNNTNG